MPLLTEEILNQKLTTPSQKLISDMKNLTGDIMVLGAGGKMGPTLCILAKNACKAAGLDIRITAVSRFSEPEVNKLLEDNGIGIIKSDLLEPGAVENLPGCENIVYMAGRKFGTDGSEHLTWAMNAWLPSLVAEKFKKSRIVVFSSGNIYPFSPIHSGGCDESVRPLPLGEYAMSCLARERMFEYAARVYGTRILMYRLNYAVDLRYGVLHDIAMNLLNENEISLTTPVFNCIWQGDANEAALRGLLHCEAPAAYINVTGPETVSVRYAAQMLGNLLGKTPKFSDEPSENALLSNSAKMVKLFGYPCIGMLELIKMQAEWIISGGRSLGKPTHFEERKGAF